MFTTMLPIVENRIRVAQVAFAMHIVAMSVIGFALLVKAGWGAQAVRDVAFLLFVQIGVAVIGLVTIKKRQHSWSLLLYMLLVLHVVDGFMGGGLPLFTGLALVALMSRPVAEYLQAWPKKSGPTTP